MDELVAGLAERDERRVDECGQVLGGGPGGAERERGGAEAVRPVSRAVHVAAVREGRERAVDRRLVQAERLGECAELEPGGTGVGEDLERPQRLVDGG